MSSSGELPPAAGAGSSYNAANDIKKMNQARSSSSSSAASALEKKVAKTQVPRDVQEGAARIKKAKTLAKTPKIEEKPTRTIKEKLKAFFSCVTDDTVAPPQGTSHATIHGMASDAKLDATQTNTQTSSATKSPQIPAKNGSVANVLTSSEPSGSASSAATASVGQQAAQREAQKKEVQKKTPSRPADSLSPPPTSPPSSSSSSSSSPSLSSSPSPSSSPSLSSSPPPFSSPSLSPSLPSSTSSSSASSSSSMSSSAPSHMQEEQKEHEEQKIADQDREAMRKLEKAILKEDKNVHFSEELTEVAIEKIGNTPKVTEKHTARRYIDEYEAILDRKIRHMTKVVAHVQELEETLVLWPQLRTKEKYEEYNKALQVLHKTVEECREYAQDHQYTFNERLIAVFPKGSLEAIHGPLSTKQAVQKLQQTPSKSLLYYSTEDTVWAFMRKLETNKVSKQLIGSIEDVRQFISGMLELSPHFIDSLIKT